MSDNVKFRYLTEEDLATLRKKNNPENLPTGRFSGRCSMCGSADLWDDETAYGCRCCGSLHR